MQTLITIVHVLAAIFLVLVILLQSGKGGGMGAALGGASTQIFGGRGAGNFLSRLTTGAAVIFFLTSLTLSVLSSRHTSVFKGENTKSPTENTDPLQGNEGLEPSDEEGLPEHQEAPPSHPSAEDILPQ